MKTNNINYMAASEKFSSMTVMTTALMTKDDDQ